MQSFFLVPALVSSLCVAAPPTTAPAPTDPVAKIRAELADVFKRAEDAQLTTKDRGGEHLKSLAVYQKAKKRFDVRLKQAKEPLLHQALLVGKLALAKASGDFSSVPSGGRTAEGTTGLKQKNAKATTQILDVLKAVPVTSEAWAVAPTLLWELQFRNSREQVEEVSISLSNAMEHNASEDVRAALFQESIQYAISNRDLKEARRLHRNLVQSCPAHPITVLSRSIMAGWAWSEPGQSAPAFEVTSLDDASNPYTLDTFKGKFLLLTFWNSDSVFSRTEADELKAIWEQFKGKNLEILMVDLQETPEDLASNLQQPDAPTIPWKLAWAADDHPMVMTYMSGEEPSTGVSMPMRILISPDGKILSAETQDLDLKGIAAFLEAN